MSIRPTFQEYGLIEFKKHITTNGTCRNNTGKYKKQEQINPGEIDDFMTLLAHNNDIISSINAIIPEVTSETLNQNISRLIRVHDYAKNMKDIFIYKHREGFKLKGANVMSYQFYASKVELEHFFSAADSDVEKQYIKQQLTSQKPPHLYASSDSEQREDDRIQENIGSLKGDILNSTLENKESQNEQMLSNKHTKIARNFQDEEYREEQALRKQIKLNESENENQIKYQSLLQELQQTRNDTLFKQKPPKMIQTLLVMNSNLGIQKESQTRKIVPSFNYSQFQKKNSSVNIPMKLNPIFLMNVQNFQEIMIDKLKKGCLTYYRLKKQTSELNIIYITIFTLIDDEDIPNPEWKTFKNYMVQGIQQKFQFENPQSYYYCKIGYTKRIERVDCHFRNYNAKFYKAFLCYREREELQFHSSEMAKQFHIPISYPKPYEGKGEIYVFHPLLECLLQQSFKKYKYQKPNK